MRLAAFQRLQEFDDASAVIARIVGDLSRADRCGVDLAVFSGRHLPGHGYEPATIDSRAVHGGDARCRAILTPLEQIAATVVLILSSAMRMA